MIGASSFEVILAWQSKFSPTGTLSSGTSGSRCISLILLHERTQRWIRLCVFCMLVNIVTETAIVSFWTLPVGFPLPAIYKNSLSTLSCPLILDHGVSFIIVVFNPKIPVPWILVDTSFHHGLQSLIIRSCFLLMNLQVIQFQYGLEFLRLSHSSFVNTSKMSSDRTFVIDDRTPSHFESNSWISSFRRAIAKTGRHHSRRNHWLQWSGRTRRSNKRSVFRERNGPLSGHFVPPDWPSFWTGYYEWLCSVLKHSSHRALQNLAFEFLL